MSSKGLATSTSSESEPINLELTIGSGRALPSKPPSSIFSRGDHSQSNKNKEAPIGDNHSKISNFHKTQNICAGLSVEKNDGVEYHNKNKKENNNIRDHQKQTSPIGSLNDMNYNSTPTTTTKRKSGKAKVEDGKKASPCCHCANKNTECLTLDCECFAREMFCSEECGCDDEDCFNTPLYEDTVDVAKEQIRSINPSAFDQNIVRGACNCHKSTCQKIDCPCLRAGLRCTEACHCQVCCNPYGERPDHQGCPSKW